MDVTTDRVFEQSFETMQLELGLYNLALFSHSLCYIADPLVGIILF
jgi:hypothetical protein